MGSSSRTAYDDFNDSKNEWKQMYDDYMNLFGDEAEALNVDDIIKKVEDAKKAYNTAKYDKDGNYIGTQMSWNEYNNIVKEANEQLKGQHEDLTNKMAERKQQVADVTASNMAQNDALATAQANMKANRNAGVNSGTASLVGTGNAANQYSNTNLGMKQTLANQNASTQADYLGKLGYANNLQQQAQNTQNGAGLLTAGAVLQGVGTGAAAGLSVSDERFKQAIDECDDEELKKRTLEQIDKFERMAARLNKLRGSK